MNNVDSKVTKQVLLPFDNVKDVVRWGLTLIGVTATGAYAYAQIEDQIGSVKKTADSANRLILAGEVEVTKDRSLRNEDNIREIKEKLQVLTTQNQLVIQRQTLEGQKRDEADKRILHQQNEILKELRK